MSVAEVLVTRAREPWEKPDPRLNGVKSAWGYELNRRLVVKFTLEDEGTVPAYATETSWRRISIPGNNDLRVQLEHGPEDPDESLLVRAIIFGKLKSGLHNDSCHFEMPLISIAPGEKTTFGFNNRQKTRLIISHTDRDGAVKREMGDPSFFLLPNINFRVRR